MGPDAVVLTGQGRYSDPWHDLAATSATLAELLDEAGLRAQVHGTDDAVVAVPPVALLVVDAGGGSTPTDEPASGPAAAWRAAALAHVRAGGPTLVAHAGCNTFYEDGDWAAAIGGRWVPGVSMHPDRGEAVLDVVGGDHPVTAGLRHLHVDDERYSHLEIASASVPLVAHQHDGQQHTCVWAAGDGDRRVVVDTLGHDASAHRGVDRVALLRREVAWLLR